MSDTFDILPLGGDAFKYYDGHSRDSWVIATRDSHVEVER